MNMFIVLVGGTGFVGRAVAERLRGEGREVRALSRRTGFDAMRPDPELLRGAAAVVNLAGIKREEGSQAFRAVHVDLVERLAAAMREAGVPRLVHVSVTAAREGPERPYAHTKWLGEQAVRASGLDWTILRPGVIYGEGDDLLAHLSWMLLASPVFPIVGRGTAPMRPVDVADVAAAVSGALANPASAGRTYEVVGPDRLELREVVRRASEALDLRTRILPTPAALMRPGVWFMERFWRRPLSTRAQLEMLREGLDGDPGPARRELGVEPAPFTPERLRPLLAKSAWRPPFEFRLLTAPPERQQLPPGRACLFALLACLAAAVSLATPDPWTALSFTLPPLAALAVFILAPVRRRLSTSAAGVLAGAALGGLHYLATLAFLPLLDRLWPAWSARAAELFAWQAGKPLAFLLPTLVLIVVAEEVLWRGVLQRLLAEHVGRGTGLLAASLLNGAVHFAAGNPLLAGAALGCGLWWGFLFAATGDLALVAFAHFAWDLLVMFGPVLR
jgi:NADH dehydrogenase